MITYDIKDLYVSIPIEETLTITKQQLLEDKDTHKTEQIITYLPTILNQKKKKHPLVILLQYVQKMHGMNNLKLRSNI